MKYLLIFFIVFTACGSKHHITGKYVDDNMFDLPKKNPTFYIFSNSKQEVEQAVIEALGGYKSSKQSEFNEYFLSEFPKGNFRLIPDQGNLSKVYFKKNGEPYLYGSIIQIVIDSVAEYTTKVSVNVVKPDVRIGKTLLPVIPHMQRIWKYKAVPATTVEEYEILLMIGKELNEENMPELIIPKKEVF